MVNRAYQVQGLLRLRSTMIVIVSCLVFSGLSSGGHAAGLGKVAVFSSLGQPLRAEIEVTATREELSGMKARLASPEAFKQANVDYATSLLSIEFSLDRRPDGRHLLKLRSDKPINDPFVDLLLELNWPTGRLVREYTFLLDPPESTAKNMVAIAPAKASRPSPVGNLSSTATSTTNAIDDDLRSKALAKVRGEASKDVIAQPTERRDGREIRRGDTMRKIASETKPEGVSLEQMLVGLWQTNPSAFDGGNMNRLKVGETLSAPEKSALEAIPAKDAQKIVATHAADWNAYRRKLSTEAISGSAMETVGQRDVAGKVTAKVEDIATPAVEPKDLLKVSKLEAKNAKGKRHEEDLIAQDKALQEVNDRILSLENNIATMQKLIELKNQQLATLQKQAIADTATPDAGVKPELAAATSSVNSQPAPAVVDKPAEVVMNPPALKSEIKPEQKPIAPPMPVQQASLLEGFLLNPLMLVGAVLLALFAGAFVFHKRRA